jgi:hypothetical protein
MKIYPQRRGKPGVLETLYRMRRLVRQASINPIIRKQAFLATKQCPKKDYKCKCYSILAWARSHILFVPDPLHHELLQDPRLIAKAIETKRAVYGDCDDFAMYIASLLRAIGLKPNFVVAGDKDIGYYHVYVECMGIPLDGTTGDMPKKTGKRMIVKI